MTDTTTAAISVEKPYFERHIFFCLNNRENGQACCAQHQAYDRFVLRHVTPFFVQSSEILRLSGREIPPAFEARIPVLEQEFKIDGQVLRDLLALKAKPVRFSEAETVSWHERLFPAVDAVLVWIETHWPDEGP